MIEFEVLARPQGKQRPRMTRFGNVYTPKETKEYEKLVQLAFQKVKPKDWKALETAVYVEIEAIFVKAKSNKMNHCTIKPDIDNIIKAILDGIQGEGNAILDDKYVTGLVVKKFWGDIDKVKVTILPMEVQS